MPTHNCRADHLVSKTTLAQRQNLCDVQIAIAQEQDALRILAVVFDHSDQSDGL